MNEQEYKSEINKLSSSLVTRDKRIYDLENALQEALAESKLCEKKCITLNNDIKNREHIINAQKKKIDEYVLKVDNLNKEINQISNNYQKIINKLDNEISCLKSTLDTLLENKDDKERLSEMCDRLTSSALENKTQKDEIDRLNSLVKEQSENIAVLKEQNKEYQRLLFAKKSERKNKTSNTTNKTDSELESKNESESESEDDSDVKVNNKNQSNEDLTSDDEELQSQSDNNSYCANKKVKKKRKRPRKSENTIRDNIENLEVQEVVVEVDDPKILYCDCGSERKIVGYEEETTVEYVPGHYVVTKYRKPIYECPNCMHPDGLNTLTPRLKNEVLAGTYVSASLIALLIYFKYFLGLPLNRQEKHLKNENFRISRKTLDRWLILFSMILIPLYEAILREIQLGDKVNIDETPLLVLQVFVNNRKSYVWVMVGGVDGRCIFYYFGPNRTKAVAEEITGDFEGYLQTDGYAAYDEIGDRPCIVHVACLDHIRRKFIKVVDNSECKNEAKSLAQQIIEQIKKIYKFDALLREKIKDEDLFCKTRQKVVTKIIDRIHNIVSENVDKTPSNSLLGKACRYFLHEEQKLRNYLLDPKLTPSNGVVERAIKSLAVGRRNWMFSGSPNGAIASCIYMTLTETAKKCGVDVQKYFTYLAMNKDKLLNETDIESLLPWNCKDLVNNMTPNDILNKSRKAEISYYIRR